MDKTLSQMVAVQMFHHSLLFFSSVWCLHLSITDEIAMNPFKCIDSVMCLFHNFVTLIVKRFACLFDCIQQVGSNDVNLKSAPNFKLVLQCFPVGNKIADDGFKRRVQGFRHTNSVNICNATQTLYKYFCIWRENFFKIDQLNLEVTP